jgi:hypothetical protein
MAAVLVGRGHVLMQTPESFEYRMEAAPTETGDVLSRLDQAQVKPYEAQLVIEFRARRVLSFIDRRRCRLRPRGRRRARPGAGRDRAGLWNRSRDDRRRLRPVLEPGRRIAQG